MIPKGSRCSAFTAIPAAGWIFAGWSRRPGNRGLKLIAVDRPGIGLSDPVEPRSLTDFGGDIEELMERLRLKRPVVMGVSGWGALCSGLLEQAGKENSGRRGGVRPGADGYGGQRQGDERL